MGDISYSAALPLPAILSAPAATADFHQTVNAVQTRATVGETRTRYAIKGIGSNLVAPRSASKFALALVGFSSESLNGAVEDDVTGWDSTDWLEIGNDVDVTLQYRDGTGRNPATGKSMTIAATKKPNRGLVVLILFGDENGNAIGSSVAELDVNP